MVKVIGKKINGTIEFHDLQNIDLATSIILSDLVQNLWSEMSSANGGQHNTFVYVWRLHHSIIFFNLGLLEGFYSSYLVLTCFAREWTEISMKQSVNKYR